jgi:CarD family transcriptional regulator
MASSKKSVNAKKAKNAKSAPAPKSKAKAKPASKSDAIKGKAAAPINHVTKTDAKASAKVAALPVATSAVKASSKTRIDSKPATKSKALATVTSAPKSASKTAPKQAAKPDVKSASKPVAKAPVKEVTAKLNMVPKSVVTSVVAPAKAVSKSAVKAETLKVRATAKSAAPAATRVSARTSEQAIEAVPVVTSETLTAPKAVAVKMAAVVDKASPKVVKASRTPAEKTAAKPEPVPVAVVEKKKKAPVARKVGGKVTKAVPPPVQPIVRLAPARLAVGSSAVPAAQNVMMKDDAVNSHQTNAGKSMKTAAAGAPVKAAEKPVAAKPGAHRTGFKVDEFIVYPAHGVGQIVSIDEQEVAGFKLELFVINFMKDKMTLKVPMPKVMAGAIRKLADAATVQRALDTLTGRARIKRTMWSRRAQEYEAKINSGDLQSIAEVVRDLYRSDAQPEQSYSERQLYEAALDRMARELAVVNKLTDAEALKLIDAQLQKGPRRGSKADIDVDAAEEIEEDVEAGGVEKAA